MNEKGSEPKAEDSHAVSRRLFLQSGAVGVAAVATGAWLGVGCAASPEEGLSQSVPQRRRSGDYASEPGLLEATAECRETEDNILGPFYREGAPMRNVLVTTDMPGTRLRFDGKVVGTDCTPLAGALIDLWQADDAGHYDNDDPQRPPPPDLFVLRGKVLADESGKFSYETLIPGRYLDTPTQYRPAHLHLKISADGFLPLTTQLFFAGDPWLGVDPWVKQSLIMTLADQPGGEGKLVQYSIVLPRQQ